MNEDPQSNVADRPRATAIAVDPVAPVAWVGDSSGAVISIDLRHGASALSHRLESSITHLSLSRDGRLVLAGDLGGSVVVRRAADAEPVVSLRCPAAVKQAQILSSSAIVTVDGFRRGLLWTRGAPQATPICSDGSTPVPFDAFGASAGGERLTLLSALDWRIWERASNRVLAAHQPIDGMRLAYLDGVVGVSSNGSRYFLYWDDCLVFDTETEALVGEGPRRLPASAAALSDDGRLLALGTSRGEVAALDVNGNAFLTLGVSPSPVVEVAIGAEGSLIGWLDEEGGLGVVSVASGTEALRRTEALSLLQAE